jgi:predicted RNA polymerase sigma factor
MVNGPAAGLAMLDDVGDRLGDHHRLHAVRAHLLELAGDRKSAIVEFRAAATRSANLREQRHLTIQAARIATDLAEPAGRTDGPGEGASSHPR